MLSKWEEKPTEDRIIDSESEGESQIIRGDILPIVDLKNYNTEGKEAHYVQINQIIGAVTEEKKIAEEAIKRADKDFMMDLKVFSNWRGTEPSQIGFK